MGPTVYQVPGFVQCNLVVLPKNEAYDFLVYCQRNPRACPVIEVTDPGNPEPVRSAPGADLRTDLPRYNVFRNGALETDEVEITDLWTRNSVGFLIGSSLTFDEALARAGVPKSEEVWVLNTTKETFPAGRFSGTLVVTMRWMTAEQAVIATQPGLWVMQKGGFAAMATACGVTPQKAALRGKPPLMITHAPGHGFITDLLADRVCIP